MKKLINIAFVFAVVSTCCVLFYGCSLPESPLVITKRVIYLDPILDYDFSGKQSDIPPRYNYVGVVNPFTTIPEHLRLEHANTKVSVVKEVEVRVPFTALTRTSLTELNLTSVVVNHKFAYAFFTIGSGNKCYKAEVGDFLGKKGLTIINIIPGKVYLSDDRILAMYR